MPHSRELINKILPKLSPAYPRHRFQYLIEQRLAGRPERIYPDIQVLDDGGGVVCVVEIGYTRPEKIRLYREIGIKDVRWYSKAGEHVHDQWENHVSVVIEQPPLEAAWRGFLFEGGPDLINMDYVWCPFCLNDGHEEGLLDDDALDYAECVEEVFLATNHSRLLLIVDCGVCDGGLVTEPSEIKDVLRSFDITTLDEMEVILNGDKAERGDIRSIAHKFEYNLEPNFYNKLPRMEQLLSWPSTDKPPYFF